jgi:hypothetical protein
MFFTTRSLSLTRVISRRPSGYGSTGNVHGDFVLLANTRRKRLRCASRDADWLKTARPSDFVLRASP